MQKGMLIAIAVGITVAVAIGAAFTFSSAMPSGQQVLQPAGTTEGHNKVVNLEEKLGISEKPSP